MSVYTQYTAGAKKLQRRAAPAPLGAEAMREMRLDRRPLAIEDAVDAGVAQRAVGRDLMLPQYAVHSCPQSLDGGAALLIEEVGAEFNRDAIQRFERMGQEQQ